MEDLEQYRDIIWLITLGVTMSGIYWKLRIEVLKVKKNMELEIAKMHKDIIEMKHLKDALAVKVDGVNEHLGEMRLLLEKHIAFHEGRESANNQD